MKPTQSKFMFDVTQRALLLSTFLAVGSAAGADPLETAVAVLQTVPREQTYDAVVEAVKQGHGFGADGGTCAGGVLRRRRLRAERCRDRALP